ncbi:MAG TPA: DUF6473 family protein [Rhizomicrobium sp.]|jgi:hypothetical protein
MRTCSIEETVGSNKAAFLEALNRKDLFEANKIVMELCNVLFEINPDEARQQIWKHFYSRLYGRGVQYQCFDFESVDYELYHSAGLKKLFRGPKPDIVDAKGRYVTLLGASQFFGRHVQRSPHHHLADALGLTCVNLSVGGAGPEYFLSPDILRIANAGLAVVLQVLSGKAVGCDEYPGGDITHRANGERVKRLKLLREIWETSPDEASRLLRKWRARYVEAMNELISHIEVPVVLVWVSARAPHEWSVDRFMETGEKGLFPHLIGEDTVRSVAARCAEFVECSRDDGLPYHFVSRFTGKKCPSMDKKGRMFWKNNYYPSSGQAARVASRVEAVLRGMHIKK